MNNAEQLTNMLIIALIILLVIGMGLIVTYLLVKMNAKKQKQKDNIKDTNKQEITSSKKIAKEYTKESIFKFLEFDKVEDNMIVQKNGNRYLMVVECQGVNYDLMSEAEKVSVEEGFLQFLNTLRHPIQIYIQARKVNLNDSIETYRKKVQEIQDELEKKKTAYLNKLQSGNYPKEELEKEFYEVTKQTNLYEYGKDIIASTERMSLNKNILNQKYYIIIPCYPEDLGNGAFDKEEIKNLAFSELYTKAQSAIRTLAGCGVNGRIMDSNELVELLYISYNRDEAEIFTLDKALRSGYEELYSTAPDILDKRMEVLDEQIEKQALEIINEKVLEVRSRKQQEIEAKEARFGELIRERAEAIIRQNAAYLGIDTAHKAIELIQQEIDEKERELEENIEIADENNQENKKEDTMKKTRGRPKKQIETKEKGGDINVGQETKTRGNKPKTSN